MTTTRLAVLISFLLAACSTGASESTATDTVPPDLDRAAAIAAAVDVHTMGCGPRVGFGTGSLIAPGVLATAAHVVAGSEEVELISSTGQRAPGSVILFDPELDFALIRLSEPIGSPLAPRGSAARAGEDGVVVLPRALDEDVTVEVAEVTVLRPTIINTTDIYLDSDVVRQGFELQGSIDPGDSGAMVVLPGGGVGVVWARSNQRENRAWAIDLPEVALDPDQLADLTSPVNTGPCQG